MRRRTLRLTTQSPCARYLHGERVIFPPIPQQPPTADEEVKMVMLMIDFNVIGAVWLYQRSRKLFREQQDAR